MIIGAHTIIYSSDADTDRAFMRDVIGLENIDVGGGWLIFDMPPAELAFHPAEKSGKHELYLICDDIVDFRAEMSEKNVTCTDVHEEPWGRLVEITLPGGGLLGVYEARHERPGDSS